MWWMCFVWAYQVVNSTGSGALEPEDLINSVVDQDAVVQLQEAMSSQPRERVTVQPPGRVWNSRWRKRTQDSSSHESAQH